MGAGQSSSQSDTPHRGLHVLRVTPSSPAFQSNIEPFFDFVVGFEGDSLSSDKDIDASELEKIVENHENRTLNLLVWNSKSKRTRVVPITPSRVWSQQNLSPNDSQQSPSNAQPSLLGLSMRLCQPETATDNVWHVLDVLEGSPAESAGLVPMGDWILGWSGGVLSAENDFYDLVEAHVDKPLRVYVYSYDFDSYSNRHWGGEGLLGCVFGFGLLHRIPPQPEDHVPGTLPAELQEQGDEYGSQDLFVPADVEVEDGQQSPSQLAEWRHQEQEQWRREVLARSTHSQPGSQSTSADVAHDHSNDHPPKSHDGSRSTPNLQASTRISSTSDLSTPTRTRSPLGPLMNGQATSLSPLLSEYSPRFLSQNGYLNSRMSTNQSRASVAETDNMELDDGDGEESSVAGTEDTSHGSLTSVE
ncbi:GRASP55/65 PDZ-like domain-containing protein [Flammula alnicola]|nr:GRASP55/65 PDZ-like domain-containing protein [Flammula alnicola]